MNSFMVTKPMKKSELKQLIKEEVESNKSKLDPIAQKVLDRKAFMFIAPNTPLEVGMEVVTKYGGSFGEIKKIKNDNYYVSFDADYVDEKPIKSSRKQLEKFFLVQFKK